MSIYATDWILKFPRYGDYHPYCEWIEVIAQGVPAHIGSPTVGCGYEKGDPYGSFLPPPVSCTEEEEEHKLRAMVIVTDETEKVMQEYVNPVLVMTGEEYEKMPFSELHWKICLKLQEGHAPCMGVSFTEDGKAKIMFTDGSVKVIEKDGE